MLGGTGFGGLIAAALSTSSLVNKNKPKYSVSDLMNFFNKRQRDIFQNEYKLATVYSSLDKVQRKIGNMRGFLYDGDGLQESIKELFTPFRKMKDLMKPTILTAHVFENDTNNQILISSENQQFKEWNISEAILASTSSPYFFPPMCFTGSSQNPENGAQSTTNVYDGGVSMMNPTDLMVQEALKLGYTLEEINVVSLGTGEYDPNDEIEDE